MKSSAPILEEITEREPAAAPERTEEKEKDLIVFVCTGNTCRSPMCAALFNALYQDTGFRAESCGLAADGSPISPNAIAALLHRGIKATPDNDYPAHRARPAEEALLARAKRIVGITSRHAMELLFRFPSCATKITAMPKDIADPFGGDETAYDACLRDIEEALALLFPREEREEPLI